MAIGVQGSVPEADGRPVMGRALAPSLLAPGGQYPAGPIQTTAPVSAWSLRTIPQAPRPPDPVVGVHHRMDDPWPVPKGYSPRNDYEGPIPEGSERYPAVHKTEPLVAQVDNWTRPTFVPNRHGAAVYPGVGQSFPQSPQADENDNHLVVPWQLFEMTWHPTGQNLEERTSRGGHVVIRRFPSATGLPGQTPYYQAPNTVRSGPPPRWDQGVILNSANPYGLS